MLKSKFRLKGKDINFLTKKKQFFGFGFFSFFYFRQYSNLDRNQISINIPLKFSKKAVKRHYIKRLVIDNIYKLGIYNTKIKGNFFKIFVMLNKNSIFTLQNQIEKQSKKTIKELVNKEFDKSWQMFIQKVK